MPRLLLFIASYLLFDAFKSKKEGGEKEHEEVSENGNNSLDRNSSGEQHTADQEHRGASCIVQIKNPKTGLYTAIDTKKGKITSHKKTPGPYKGIKIIRGKFNEKILNKRESNAGPGGRGNDLDGKQEPIRSDRETEIVKDEKTENNKEVQDET